MHTARSITTIDRSAFSLLELMIVILIISLVYVLIFATIQRNEKQPRALQPDTLKSTLFEQGLYHTRAEFFCLDKCSNCYLYQDGETKKYEGKIALGDITAYQMGRNGKLEKIEFGRYQDHPVCLRFQLHTNGSSSKIVLQNRSGIYYLPALFGEAEKVASLEEAEKLWLKYNRLLSDSGEVY